jgi:hypothetical protein
VPCEQRRDSGPSYELLGMARGATVGSCASIGATASSASSVTVNASRSVAEMAPRSSGPPHEPNQWHRDSPAAAGRLSSGWQSFTAYDGSLDE